MFETVAIYCGRLLQVFKRSFAEGTWQSQQGPQGDTQLANGTLFHEGAPECLYIETARWNAMLGAHRRRGTGGVAVRHALSACARRTRRLSRSRNASARHEQ